MPTSQFKEEISLFVIVVYLKHPVLFPSDYFLVEKFNREFSLPLISRKFSPKLLIASRNGKGVVAFRGSRPSDGVSFSLDGIVQKEAESDRKTYPTPM